VQENGLQQLELHEVGHWWFADVVLNKTMEEVCSMNKSHEHGFLGWCETEKSFLSTIDKARANRVVP
jgi:hypothetical protein